MAHTQFHVAIHGFPANLTPGSQVMLWGRSAATVTTGEYHRQEPLPVTFEEAEEKLGLLPRLFFEPDGSFGWFSAPGETRWEIGGILYDRGDKLMYAELRGSCPHQEFRQLLFALHGGRSPVLVQLVEQALYFTDDEFCRILGELNANI